MLAFGVLAIFIFPLNDVFAATFVDSFYVENEEIGPSGLVFNPDGTKVFVSGPFSDNVNEYPCTTGFDVSTCNAAGVSSFDVSAVNLGPTGMAFSDDGEKLFVTNQVNGNIYEYPCTTGFDVSTCNAAGVSSFDVSGQDTMPQDITFNTDGTKMFVVGNQNDFVNEYDLYIAFDIDSIAPSAADVSTSTSGCYDCIPPKLQQAQIQISSNEKIITTDDELLHITANVGDKVTVILNVTDNKSVDTIPFAALYTNYQEKPSDMSAFYANNFDNLKQISTSFYEWNVRSDDVPYDYDGTITWSDNTPTVVTDVTTADNFKFKNDDNNMVEYFMIPFTFTINDFMEQSTITAKIYDASGNRLHVTLPVTLETAGNEPPDFDNMGKQKVLGFYDESVLSEMVEQWSESESDAKQLSSLLGISEEQLPPWTSNLATWVAEGTIDSAEMIVAVEYLINQ